jgi:hypothetical protein
MAIPRRSEAEFLAQVLAFAKLHGWRSFHARAARTAKGWRTPVAGDGKGFLDCLFARERLVFAELKAKGGRVTPEQQEWIDGLRAAGAEVYVWHDDKSWGEITSVLGRSREDRAREDRLDSYP